MKFSYDCSVNDLINMSKNKEITNIDKFEDSEDLKDDYNHNSIIDFRSKNVAIMCGKCFGIYEAEYTTVQISSLYSKESPLFLSINNNPIHIEQCKYCNQRYPISIELDINIAQSISIFNKKGYSTKFCCESHNNGDQGYIYFKNNKILDYIDYLPDSWYLDLTDIKEPIFDLEMGRPVNKSNIIIRTDYYSFENSMIDILEFAKSLPHCCEKELKKLLLSSKYGEFLNK